MPVRLLRQVVGKDHVGSNVISFGEIGKKLGGEWRAMDEVTPKTHPSRLFCHDDDDDGTHHNTQETFGHTPQ